MSEKPKNRFLPYIPVFIGSFLLSLTLLDRFFYYSWRKYVNVFFAFLIAFLLTNLIYRTFSSKVDKNQRTHENHFNTQKLLLIILNILAVSITIYSFKQKNNNVFERIIDFISNDKINDRDTKDVSDLNIDSTTTKDSIQTTTTTKPKTSTTTTTNDTKKATTTKNKSQKEKTLLEREDEYKEEILEGTDK